MTTVGTPREAATVPPMPLHIVDHALCARPPARFYQWVPDAETPANVEPLLATCARCPVQLDCAAWAMDARVTGVWGGLTSNQRARLIGRTLPGRPRRR